MTGFRGGNDTDEPRKISGAIPNRTRSNSGEGNEERNESALKKSTKSTNETRRFHHTTYLQQDLFPSTQHVAYLKTEKMRKELKVRIQYGNHATFPVHPSRNDKSSKNNEMKQRKQQQRKKHPRRKSRKKPFLSHFSQTIVRKIIHRLEAGIHRVC